MQQLPLMLTYITGVYCELEATGADDPSTDRGEVLYGSSLWSSGRSCGGYDSDGGYDDYAAGVLGLTASEEARAEAERRAAVGIPNDYRGKARQQSY